MESTKYVFLISTVTFLLYSNSLWGEFVYDDNRAIIQNHDLRREAPWSNLLQNDFWGVPIGHSGSHKSFRPLTTFSFKLNYAFHELNSFGYHLVNVILHCLTTGAVFKLSRNLHLSEFTSVLASAIFGVHPIHCEAVSGIVGRADELSTLIVILALICLTSHIDDFIPHEQHSRRASDNFNKLNHAAKILATIFLGWLAVLSKETGISLFALAFIYLLLYRKLLVLPPPRKTIASMIPALILDRDLLAIVFGGLVGVIGRMSWQDWSRPSFSPSDNPASHDHSWQTRTLTFFHLAAFNAKLVLLPADLSFDWSMGSIPLVQSVFDPRNLETLAFFGLFTAALFRTASIWWRGNCGDHDNVAATINYPPRNGSPTTKRSRKLSDSSNTSSSTGGSAECLDFNGNILLKSGTNNNKQNSSKHHTSACKNHHRSQQINNGGSATSQWDSNNNNNKDNRFLNPNTDTRKNQSINHKKDGNMISDYYCDSGKTYYYALERSRNAAAALFCLLALPFVFLPQSNLLFYVGFVVAERTLYLPSVFISILLSLSMEKIDQRSLRTVAISMLLMTFSLKTWQRNFDWTSEERLYKSGIPISPAKSSSNLGSVYSRLGRKSEAEYSYRLALKHRGNMADTHYNLGTLLHGAERLREAVDSYEAAIHFRPRLANAHLNLGLALWTLRRNLKARERFEKCWKLSDGGLKDPVTHLHARISCKYNLGRIVAESPFEDYRLSVEHYEEAIREAEGSAIPHSHIHSIHNMLGEAYSKLGDLSQAERQFRTSLRLKPDHIPAHLTYATLLIKKKMFNGALKMFEKALKLDPNNGVVMEHLGVYYADLNQWSKAASAFEKALKFGRAENKSLDLMLQLAGAYRQLGQNKRAEGIYAQAVEKNPKSSIALSNYGAILHLNKQYDRAVQTYRRTLKLNPSDSITLDNLRKVERLLRQREQTAS